MHVPACCLNCGYVFPSGITVSNSTHFSTRGSYATCPRCRSTAAIPEGVMDIVGGVVRLVSGPDFTKEVFEAIGVVVEDLRRGKVSVPQAIEKVRTVSPEAAKEFRDWTMWGMAFILFVWQIAAAVMAWKDNPQTNLPVEMVVDSATDEFFASDAPQPVTTPPMTQTPGKKGDVRPMVVEQFKNRHQRRAEKAKKTRNLQKKR